jgi:hypothetical protein
MSTRKDEIYIRINNLVQISNNNNEHYFGKDKQPSLLGRYGVIKWIIQVYKCQTNVILLNYIYL